MHTYVKGIGKDDTWDVGFYRPITWRGGAFGAPRPTEYAWHTVRTYDTERQAAAFANYLNGGDGKWSESWGNNWKGGTSP